MTTDELPQLLRLLKTLPGARTMNVPVRAGTRDDLYLGHPHHIVRRLDEALEEAATCVEANARLQLDMWRLLNELVRPMGCLAEFPCDSRSASACPACRAHRFIMDSRAEFYRMMEAAERQNFPKAEPALPSGEGGQ